MIVARYGCDADRTHRFDHHCGGIEGVANLGVHYQFFYV
jgi:hypothetical protein